MSKHSLDYLANNILVGNAELKKAWHYRANNEASVANHYDGYIPAEDVLAKLFSWSAIPVPMLYSWNGQPLPYAGKQVLVRDDLGLPVGASTEAYGIHQFADSLLDAAVRITGNGTGLGITSAGVLGHGAQGFVSIGLDEARVIEGVAFMPYLTAYGSHDGSLVTGYRKTVILPVCDNTLSAALRGKGAEIRVKHTRHSALRIKDAQQALGLVEELADEFAGQVTELVHEPVSDAEFDAFLAEFVPIAADAKAGRGLTMAETKRAQIADLYRNDKRCSPWVDTQFGVIQAVNTWSTHLQGVRGQERAERNQRMALTGAWDTIDSGTLETLRRVQTA